MASAQPSGQLPADPLMGSAMEFDAIAAVVIGVVSLYGGRGMLMIRNGPNLMGVSPFWQGAAIGTIMIVAVLVERRVRRRAHR